tara:strand:- start:243 stop:977 length:735 start_codon:yes stop_codon:yes gene_type:complete
MKNIISILILILFFSCKIENKKEEKNIEPQKTEKIKIDSSNTFINEIRIDTTIKPLGKVVELELSNGKKSENIFALCSCQKDKKNHMIKIQLRSGIPTKNELDSTGITDKSGGRFMHLMDLGALKRIDGQFKFLTFILKDSLLTDLQLYSKSTELEYDGEDFKSMDIDKYKIAISTFDYSIASNVYGNFELRLPQGFGYFENDTILKGHFECNNWKISSKEEIKEWDIHKSFKNRNNDRGFKIK